MFSWLLLWHFKTPAATTNMLLLQAKGREGRASTVTTSRRLLPTAWRHRSWRMRACSRKL